MGFNDFKYVNLAICKQILASTYWYINIFIFKVIGQLNRPTPICNTKSCFNTEQAFKVNIQADHNQTTNGSNYLLWYRQILWGFTCFTCIT